MNTQERQEWLDSLKEGDKVALNLSRHGGRSYEITEITRVTPNRQFRLKSNPTLLFKKGGDCHPDRFYYYHVEPITEEIVQHINRKVYLSKAKSAILATLTTNQLKRIYDIINEVGEAK